LQSLLRAFYASLIAIAALSGMARTARAQLYVSQLGILTVSEYNATTGVAINANLITRLSTPSRLAVQGNTLFVANEGGSVGKYDAFPKDSPSRATSSLWRTSSTARLASTTPLRER
jgi:hypothetical protein